MAPIGRGASTRALLCGARHSDKAVTVDARSQAAAGEGTTRGRWVHTGRHV